MLPAFRVLNDQPSASIYRKEEETLERERKEREARRIAGMRMAAENQKVGSLHRSTVTSIRFLSIPFDATMVVGIPTLRAFLMLVPCTFGRR